MTRDTGISDLVTCKDYAYDALNRMTSDGKRGYTYDTLGNLIQERDPGKQLIQYQYNALNELTDKKVCDYTSYITGIHDYKYEYDNRGNLVHEYEVCAPTTQGPRNITIGTYTYDETNRMTVGRNEKNEASVYTYNGLGIRVGQEMITEDNTHGYTDFHCDTPSIDTGIKTPEVVLRSFVIDYTSPDQRVLMESEAGGTGFDYQYMYGNHKLSLKVTSDGIDWWGQAIHENIMKAYTHVDRLGSTVGLTDDYGRVMTRVQYSEWGDLIHTEPITIEHGFRMISPQNNFTGHEYDDVLGMYYAKARMYDQANRRFTAMDPVKGDFRDPLSVIPYLYVKDNPMKWIDPLGMVSKMPDPNAPPIFTMPIDLPELTQEDLDRIRELNSPHFEQVETNAPDYAGIINVPNSSIGRKMYSIYVPEFTYTNGNSSITPPGYSQIAQQQSTIRKWSWTDFIAALSFEDGSSSVQTSQGQELGYNLNGELRISGWSMAFGVLGAAQQAVKSFSMRITEFKQNGVNNLSYKATLEMGQNSDNLKDRVGTSYMLFVCSDTATMISQMKALGREIDAPSGYADIRMSYDANRKDSRGNYDIYLLYLFFDKYNKLNAYPKRYPGDTVEIVDAFYIKEFHIDTSKSYYDRIIKIDDSMKQPILDVLDQYGIYLVLFDVNAK